MATDTDARDRARARVNDEMVRQGLNNRSLAAKAGVDVDTIADFLNGKRWPQPARRNMIATALGWAPHAIDQILRGEQPGNGSTETVSDVDQDSGVLLDIDREDFESLDPMTQKRAMAEMTALFYKIAEDARRRADSE